MSLRPRCTSVLKNRLYCFGVKENVSAWMKPMGHSVHCDRQSFCSTWKIASDSKPLRSSLRGKRKTGLAVLWGSFSPASRTWGSVRDSASLEQESKTDKNVKKNQSHLLLFGSVKGRTIIERRVKGYSYCYRRTVLRLFIGCLSLYSDENVKRTAWLCSSHILCFIYVNV